MIQTLALFLDSYRELNSKKLFWITIIISIIVVLLFLAVGIDSEGVTFFGRHLPLGEGYNSQVVSQSTFFRATFFQCGVNYWLTWIASILALVSTAGIFPDLISGGSIDLYLSKPISRPRLFLTKYLAGLLFVGLQVGAFVATSIIVLRVRAGGWYPKIFLAVPVVLLFYSYIYCVSVMLGVMTRSTITAVILTILFWLMIACVQWFESSVFLPGKVKAEIVATRLDRTVARAEERARTGEVTSSVWHVDSHQRLEDLRAEQRDAHKQLDLLTKLHGWTYRAECVFPKTSDTVELMRRWLISAAEDKRVAGDLGDSDKEDEPVSALFGITSDDKRAIIQTEKILRERSIGWSIGSSLAFEAVLVGFSAWLFCRRDY